MRVLPDRDGAALHAPQARLQLGLPIRSRVPSPSSEAGLVVTTPPRIFTDRNGDRYIVSRRRPRSNDPTKPGETYRQQLKRLGDYLLKHHNDAIGVNGQDTAVDIAIYLLEKHRLDPVTLLGRLEP